MEEILADQVVIIPLYVHPLGLAWRVDVIGGYGRQVNTEALWDVDQWYLVEG